MPKGLVGTAMTTQKIPVPKDVVHLIRKKTPLCLKCKQRTQRWQKVKHCLIGGIRGFKHHPDCQNPDFYTPKWFLDQKRV